MSEQEMWRFASACYESAGHHADAARCGMRAGEFRRAADLYLRAGMDVAAAEALAAAEAFEEAAWLLAHHTRDPVAARAMLDRVREPRAAAEPVRAAVMLSRRLIVARCVVQERGRLAEVIEVLADVQNSLATHQVGLSQQLEEWAVALAESMDRHDQVALIFAAAVRGGRYAAAQRWRAWAEANLGASIILPAGVAS